MRPIRDRVILCAVALGVCAPQAAAQCPAGAMASLFWLPGTGFRQSGFAVDMARLPSGQLLLVSTDLFYGPDVSFGGAGHVFLGTPDGAGGYTWTQEAALRAADIAAFDQSGYCTAIIAPPGGDTLAIVGSNLDDHVGADAGSASVFSRGAGGVWSQEGLLKAPDAAAGDQFGKSAAISTDAALVGSPEDDDGAASAGSAYIFARSPIGMAFEWTMQAKLTAFDPSASAKFGSAAAISGEWALVGAPFDDQAAANAGAVYVFRRMPDGMGGYTWPFHSKLVAPDAAASDQFGASLSTEGGLLLIGAIFGGAGDTGAAYVFRLEDNGMSGSAWEHEERLTPIAGQATSGDQCGKAVDLRDGLALLGAHEDDDGGTNAGSAFLFRRVVSGGTPGWAQASKIRLPTPAATDDFAFSVGLAGGWAAIGSPAHNQYGTDRGNTFVLPTPAPPVILSAPSDQSINAGDTLALTSTIAGRGPATIQWFRGVTLLEDGGRISGATTDSLTITDTDEADAGEYRIIASNDCGPSEASAIVTVAPPPLCSGDANGDRIVNFADVTAVLANFGAHYWPGSGPGDADGSGNVNFADVTAVLSNWGLPCP